MRVAAADLDRGGVGGADRHLGAADDDADLGAGEADHRLLGEGPDPVEGHRAALQRVEEGAARVDVAAGHVDDQEVIGEDALEGVEVAVEQRREQRRVGGGNGVGRVCVLWVVISARFRG